ncbi:MAG: GNAT family N-acetyltransferase [Alphaproteobacteria bacterium]|nr:GNAT family N-acetyltransferase [Alphaproteobacteria bacterium]
MGRRVSTVVTFLEMFSEPRMRPTPPLEAAQGRLAVLRTLAPPTSYYRYLYDAVGSPWKWVERKRMSDDALRAIIDDPNVEILVLYADGWPAGFAELDAREPGLVNLSYFGLMPEAIGRHFGGFFLHAAVKAAWEKGPERVTVNTCTLDHPRALPLYQRLGFTPYAQREAFIELPDET